MHSDRLADTTITSITGILHTATVSVITSEADSSKANVQHAKHQHVIFVFYHFNMQLVKINVYGQLMSGLVLLVQ